MKRINQMIAIISILALAIFSFGCDGGSSGGSGGPAESGPFSGCTYAAPYNSGYSDAEVFYPCSGGGPFAGTTLTGGFTNTWQDMEWMADHLVTHGYVIIAMTPNNNLGNNPQWTTAHKAGIAVLKSENARSASQIYGMVNTGALQTLGYSKGGGGSLLASAELGNQLKSTQAMAPYMDGSYDLSGISSPTICYTGVNDIIASPSAVVDMFNSLPTSIDRTLAYFNGVGHLAWTGPSASESEMMLTYITSWMKVYLDEDSSYASYIDGSQDWFNQFEHYDAGEGGSSSGGCN